jgi:glucose/galactose transporter
MSTSKNYVYSITIIGVLFFIFGFVTWMNGTLIPYLKIACELKTDFQSYLVATCFFIAYTVMAIPSFTVIRKVGYKRSMSIGLIIMAVGAALFLPAANTRNYDLFLIGLFIIGTGMALLQTAANPYAAIIGPMESAATRISIMGICNKIAGILAGLIFGYIALKDADALEASMKTMDTLTKNATLDSLASRVIIPYLSIAGILVIVSNLIFFSSLPNIDVTSEKSESTSYSERTSVLQFPHLFLGVIAMFLYVGVEVLAGDTIISYGKSLGIELSTARYFTQATLACMLIGYIVGIIAIPKYISQSNALKICSLIGVLFTIGAVLSSGYFSVAFIALLGIANSLMWPSIFPLAIDGLGKFTKIGSAFLIMAIAGGAILPLAYGYLSDEWNSQQAYWIMMPCYLFILYFSVKGYKYGKA